MLLPPSVLTLFGNAYKRNAITMYKVTSCLLMKRSKYQNLNLCWKFVLDNDNSFELLYKKKEVVWSRRDTIEFLHRKSLAEAMVVSPGYLVKPKAEDWGTGLCKIYKYPEFKWEALKEPGVNLEWLLSLYDVQLKNWGDQQNDQLIMYKDWQSKFHKLNNHD